MTALVVKEFFSRDVVKTKLTELLGKNASTFATSVLQIVNSNDMLAEATPSSIFNAACMAATLNLPINANLGFAHIVPYRNRGAGTVDAQFQLGYKGFIQLAQRSGQFKIISYAVVHEGQLVSEDPLKGYVFDWSVKSDKVIGYVSYFQLLNGFESYLYMSHEQAMAHGKRYSQSFKKNYGVWHDNFDAMALKTVVKLNLSQKAPLSIDLQKAIEADQGIIKENGAIEYVDAQEVIAKSPPAFYPQDQFDTNLQKWKKVIEGGKPVDDLIAMIESKAPLTEAQKSALKAPAVVATDADGVMHTFDQIKSQLEKADALDKLADAATLINSIEDKKQKAALTAIYEERGAQLN